MVNLEEGPNDYLRAGLFNLDFLTKKRYDWMNCYISNGDRVLEVGCGIRVTKMFINAGSVTLSDIPNDPWIDRQEDALNLSNRDESLGVILVNNS